MAGPDHVLIEVLIAAPIDVVWQALRDPAEIRRWFGWDYPALNDEIEMIFVGGDTRAYTSGETRIVDFPEIHDRFTVEPHGEHTILRVVRSAPSGPAGWQGIYDDTAEGWIKFVQQLKFALEHHRGQDRRTIFFSGRARTADAPLAAEALGLGSAERVRVGQRFSANAATGDALAGAVWARSTYQLVLELDTFGHGLLVILDKPQTEKSPHGGGLIILTTYGLDDATFEALQTRWQTWWDTRFESKSVEEQPA